MSEYGGGGGGNGELSALRRDGEAAAEVEDPRVLSSDHYERYAALDTLDRVSLQDYGPRGALRTPWILTVVLLTRYSAPRADYLFDPDYLAHHWKSYLALWVAWLLLCLGPAWVTCDACMTPSMALPIAFLGWFFPYPVSWSILAWRKEFMALFAERKTALQTWEFILWFGWFMQGVVYIWVIPMLPYGIDQKMFGFAVPQWFWDSPLVFAFGVGLTIFGSTIKMYCAYLSGLNNYYYYDMMLDRPNERFVDSGLYKWFGSPTYHIGYVDGYGSAFLFGRAQIGSPLLAILFTLAAHVTIFVVNERVEQRFVQQMYLSGPVKPVQQHEMVMA